MTKREKAIKGLKHCIEKLDTIVNKTHGFNCIDCPYFRKCDRSGYLIGLPLMRDALSLLEAQEPRLLGLDEIKMLGLMWLESRNGFVQPVICQDYEYGVDRFVEFIMVHGTICNSINTFGKLWRVWTSRPTEGQRKAMAWE